MVLVCGSSGSPTGPQGTVRCTLDEGKEPTGSWAFNTGATHHPKAFIATPIGSLVQPVELFKPPVGHNAVHVAHAVFQVGMAAVPKCSGAVYLVSGQQSEGFERNPFGRARGPLGWAPAPLGYSDRLTNKERRIDQSYVSCTLYVRPASNHCRASTTSPTDRSPVSAVRSAGLPAGHPPGRHRAGSPTGSCLPTV